MIYSDEPSVDSKDKQERILARRKRIANRRENAKLKQKEYSQMTTNGVEMHEEMDNLLKQIKQSKLLLQKIKLDGFEMIGKIKTDIDAQEIKRRVQEEETQIKRKENLSNDKEVTLDKFEEISKKWNLATKEDNAYKLKDLLDKQREACDSLLQSKDTLLEELKNILKEKDKLYVDELKRQNDDITQISIKMNNQIDLLKTSYKNQLAKIEDIFVKEMNGVTSNMDERWNRLLKERVFKETEYAKNRDIQMEVFEQKLNEQRVKDTEEYNRIKIKLDRNIESLQLQIQEMQVTHQMNQEKLEYNYQVLRRRDEENVVMKGLQKKKIKRLQELLLSLNRKAVINEESLKNSYAKYIDDYKSLVDSFKSLLERTKSNFGARNHKYKAVWAMNEEECRRMAGRILDINMVLYQQQLCLPWNPPDIPLLKDERPVDERIIGFKKKIENRNKSGKDTDADENDKSSKDTNFKNEKVVNKELKRKSSRKTSKLYKLNNSLKTDELMKLKKDLEISVNNNNNNGKSKKPFFNDKISVFGEPFEDQKDKKDKVQFEEDYFYEEIVNVDECLDVVPPKLIKHIFELICDKTGFLVEEKIWSMLNTLSPNEQTLMKLDSVLSVMQIEKKEDIKILSKYFLKKGTKYKLLEKEREEEKPFEVKGIDIDEVQNPYPTEREINQMVKLEAPKIETKEEVVDEGEYASFLIKPNEVLLGLKAFVEENVNQETCDDMKLPGRTYISTDPGTLTNNLQEIMAVLPKATLDDILLKNNLYDLYNETELKYQKQDNILYDDYWLRYAQINTPYQKIWDALETCFYKYYKLLIDRANLIEKKDNLVMQNIEYRRYLETCRKNNEKLPDI